MSNLKIKYPKIGAEIISFMSEKDPIERFSIAAIFGIFLGEEKDMQIRETVGELMKKRLIEEEGGKFYLTPEGYRLVEEEKAKARSLREEIFEDLRLKYRKQGVFLDYRKGHHPEVKNLFFIHAPTDDSFVSRSDAEAIIATIGDNKNIKFRKWDTSPEDMPAGTEHSYVFVSEIIDDGKVSPSTVEERLKETAAIVRQYKSRIKELREIF